MKGASHFVCLSGAAALGLGLATSAHADNSGGPSVSSIGSLALGNVVAATSGVTVFFVDETSGNVSVTSGSGVRTTSGSARALVTLACGTDSKCSTNNVAVKVGSINLTTGRGQALSNLDIQINSGALSGSTPSRGNPINFTLQPIGRNGTASFYVGGNVPIAGDDSGLATGSATAAFYVYVAYAGTTPSSGSTGGLATATVTRGLGLSSSGTLNFGTLIKPTSGTGTADVDPDQGAYHNTNIIATPSSTPSRVVFTATGQPSTAISVNVPHDFYISTPGGAKLDVTLSSNAGSSETLNSAGSYTFGVGGSINVSSTTLSGVYSGAFVVSVCYN